MSGASLMKLQAVTNPYTVTASAVYTAAISGYPIGGGSELVGSASATAYGSSMEFNFPLDPNWGFGTIWASARYYSIDLNTADNSTIEFYSAATASAVKELAWKDDVPSAVDIGIYEDIYHNKYVSSINSMQVSAKWAGSASDAAYAYTAEQDPFGRNLSALADKSSVPSGISSPNGTIIANGFNVEATNSAVATTVVPGYATTVAGDSGQLRPDTPVACTLPSANENSKLFFTMDWGSVIDISAVYDGITATASAGAGNVDVVIDVPNATTVSLYGSYYRNMLGSASASAADYLAPGSVAELAWASALPTYSYDAEDKISGINGSALAGTTYSAGTGIDITDDVISVETPVDIVAGPGIVIDNPDGNTLRVSVDQAIETVLWDNYTFANNKAESVAMTETPFNFSQIRITFYIDSTSESWGTLQTQIIDMVALASSTNKYFTLNGTVVNGNDLIVRGSRCKFNGTEIEEHSTIQWYTGGIGPMTQALHIYRIVGVGRTASN